MEVFEFRVVNSSTGLADVVLPDVETYTIAPMKADVGTLTFTYPTQGLNQSHLVNDTEIAVWYKGVEVPSLRSTLEQIAYDEASTAEGGDLGTYTCRMNLSRLDRGTMYPQNWPTSNIPPSQQFTNATAGTCLLTMVNKLKARGGLTYIDTSSFTATHDSAGNPWTTTLTVAIAAGTDYLTCFQNFVSYAMCEGEMDIYTLKLYDTQTMGVDRTLGSTPLVFRRGKDLSQSNIQRSTKGMSNVALVAGNGNIYAEATVSTGFDRRETSTSIQGAGDVGTLTSLGQLLLGQVDEELVGRTIALNFADPTTPIPIDNFGLGDWVYVDINDGVLHRQRVIQWTVTMASDGVLTGTVALDTIFQERVTRLLGKLNAIENGAVILGGSQPIPVPKDLFLPAVPTGLAVGSNTYTDNQGHTFVQANLTWTPVTQDTSGATLTDLAGYYMRWKLHAATVWSQNVAVDPTSAVSYLSPLLPNQSIDFAVGALNSQGGFSGWSTTLTATMATDTTAPNEPSTPVVSSKLGQLAIVWDGKDNTSSPMPVDFSVVQIHVSTGGSGFTPTSSTLTTTLANAGTAVVLGVNLIYGTIYYVKLIAVDQSSNLSVPSVAGSAMLVQVVNTDITTGQVGLNSLSFSDIGNLVDDGSFEDPNWQATRTAQYFGTHFILDNTTSSVGLWSTRHDSFAGLGHEQVILATISAKPGQTFMGAADFKANSSVVGSGTIAYVSVEAYFLNSSGVTISHAHLTDNWTSPATNDNAWHARVSGTPRVAPAGTVQMQVVLTSDNHDAGTIWIDALEVRMQVDTLLVANAAITDAQIANVTADKITAGTLNAGVVIGTGLLGTGTTGQRVNMDSTGLHAYDSAGNKIFDLSDATPVLTLGKNGSSGASVTLDTSGSYPTIYLNPTGGSGSPAFINGVSFGGSGAGIGINSGQFTVGGGAHSYRLFFTDTVAQIGMVNGSAVSDGGVIGLTYTTATIGVNTAGAAESEIVFNTSGLIHLHGKWQDTFAVDSNDSIFMTGSQGINVAVTGVSIGFGVTFPSTPMVTATPAAGGSGLPASKISALSTTGFTFIIAGPYGGTTWSIQAMGMIGL